MTRPFDYFTVLGRYKKGKRKLSITKRSSRSQSRVRPEGSQAVVDRSSSPSEPLAVRR